jgi:hypothetical protein
VFERCQSQFEGWFVVVRYSLEVLVSRDVKWDGRNGLVMRRESSYTERLPFATRAGNDAVIGIDFREASGLDIPKKQHPEILRKLIGISNLNIPDKLLNRQIQVENGPMMAPDEVPFLESIGGGKITNRESSSRKDIGKGVGIGESYEQSQEMELAAVLG